ncbi:hypothetical protein LXL04_034208 [Taraxacum kok-saghyz]
MDRTGSIWVTAFQESGEERTGVSSKELRFMKYEEGDEERFTTTIRNLCELSVNIMDHTESIWVTAFQESREERTGVSAKELDFMKYDEGAEERFTRTIRNVLHNWFNFKLKVKEESYNDESRVNSTVVKAEQVKPKPGLYATKGGNSRFFKCNAFSVFFFKASVFPYLSSASFRFCSTGLSLKPSVFLCTCLPNMKLYFMPFSTHTLLISLWRKFIRKILSSSSPFLYAYAFLYFMASSNRNVWRIWNLGTAMQRQVIKPPGCTKVSEKENC